LRDVRLKLFGKRVTPTRFELVLSP
jgi:hypothetical protein